MILYLAGSTSPKCWELMANKVGAPDWRRERGVELMDVVLDRDRHDVCANHFLFTFADPSARKCAKHFCMQHQRRLFIDSGAYSAWTKHKEIDPDKYIEFCKDIKARSKSKWPVVFAALDFIAGTKANTRRPTERQLKRAFDKGWANYHDMKKEGIEPCLMTYHQYEPTSFLNQIVEESDYFAVSPRKGKRTSKETKRYWLKYDVFNYLQPLDMSSGEPRLKYRIHGLGVSSPEFMFQFPFYSVDTTAALRGQKDRKLISAFCGRPVAETREQFERSFVKFCMEIPEISEIPFPDGFFDGCPPELLEKVDPAKQRRIFTRDGREMGRRFGVPGVDPDPKGNSGRYWLGARAMEAYVTLEQCVTEYWRQKGLILDEEQLALQT